MCFMSDKNLAFSIEVYDRTFFMTIRIPLPLFARFFPPPPHGALRFLSPYLAAPRALLTNKIKRSVIFKRTMMVAGES